MDPKYIPPRISMQTIYKSILAVFNFEKGLSFTLKNLLLKPGKTLNNYLYTDERSKHIKPMSFLFLMITIATFLTLQLLKSQSPEVMNGSELTDALNGSTVNLGNVSQELQDSLAIFNKWMSRYFHIFQLMKVPFFALTTLWIFRKKQFNYAEHLIINSFIIGFVTFLFILAFPVMLINMKVFSVLIGISVLYTFIAYILVFDEKSIKGFFKSIASYLLATLLHLLFMGLFVLGIYLSL